jgi:hypothetical protein
MPTGSCAPVISGMTSGLPFSLTPPAVSAAWASDDLRNVRVVGVEQRRIDRPVAGVEDRPRHLVCALDGREHLHCRRAAVHVARPGDMPRNRDRHRVKALAADHVLFVKLDIEALDAKALRAEIARLIFEFGRTTCRISISRWHFLGSVRSRCDTGERFSALCSFAASLSVVV